MENVILKRLSRPWICSSCRHQRALIPIRPRRQPFTSSVCRRAEDQPASSTDRNNENPSNIDAIPAEASQILSNLSRSFGSQQKKPNNAWDAERRLREFRRRERDPNYSSPFKQSAQSTAQSTTSSSTNVSPGGSIADFNSLNFNRLGRELQYAHTSHHHFHIYATKHNTHITLTTPARNPILSLSAGNIGFRKAARGTYDAAYQLAAYVLKTVQEKGIMGKIATLEVVLRGFGPGREAVTKVLLGSEGRWVRGKIKKVTDATRLKFGGTRSPKPRRLG